jgi:protein-disulfide isomerase
MVLVTGGAVVAGIALVLVLQLLPKSAGPSGPAVPGTRTAAGILVPAIGTPTSLAQGRFLGSANAPLKLAVWSDFQCPACRYFVQNDESNLIRDYVATGQLQLEYRDFILISEQSTDLAVAARCAGRQDKFWQYHDVVFANQGTERTGWADRRMIDNMADAVGLDRAAFDACLATAGPADEAKAQTDQGRTVVKSTPTLEFVGIKVVNGAPTWDQLKQQVDEMLAALPASSPGASK